MIRFPSRLMLVLASLALGSCELPGAAPAPKVSTEADTADRTTPTPDDYWVLNAAPASPGAPAPDASTAAVLAETPRSMAGLSKPRVVPDPPFDRTEVARFDQPWAMVFLPDGRLLVTEKPGRLKLLDLGSRTLGDVRGLPAVAFGGQGGLGDVVLHPRFASNGLVYFSFAEAGPASTRGAAVARARLLLDASGTGGALEDVQVVWRQLPKVTGEGHYGHRLAFDANDRLWITSGDRQKLAPAQDLDSALGKLVRLNDDGSTPADNPFFAQGGTAAQVWSLGHRNPLGLAFDAQQRLWVHEMGPAGGDELNLIERGANHGWPLVSEGNHYDGAVIPRHSTRPEFAAPKIWWSPVIAPSGFIIYSGDMFPDFRGDGFIGGLASQALIRVEFDGTTAREAKRYPMGRRIREVEQGPDGALWVLEDGVDARLLKLTRNF
jgi:glucose/arabinose dehydrogenase